jgi:hypothetical protein
LIAVNDTARAIYSAQCYNTSEVDGLSITGFGVGYDQGPSTFVGGFVWGTGGINITTILKIAPGCRGILRRRTCSLLPATVEYDVRLTNDTIALRSDARFGYQLGEGANASTNANANASAARNETIASAWQPPQDRVVALRPSYTNYNSIWSGFFMQVYLTAATSNVWVSFVRLTDCVYENGMPQSASNTSCRNNRLYRHDLAQEYAVEPDYSAALYETGKDWVKTQCRVYWRDPMQVCNAT